MKRTKYSHSPTFFILITVVFLALVTVCVALGIRNAEEHSRKRQLFIESILSSLESKYGRNVTFLEYYWDYHGAPAILVCFEDEPDCSFVSYEKIDLYFQAHLICEATQMLQECVPGASVSVTVSLMRLGLTEYDRLYLELYRENKRAISWKDSECQNTLERIVIRLSEELSEQSRQVILSEIVSQFTGRFRDTTHVSFVGEGISFDYEISSSEKIQFAGERQLQV